MSDEEFLTIQETAKFLNVKVSWLRSAVFRKAIPYIKIQRLIRFKRSELLAWIEKR